ncbi:CDP-glucose 4,6-dehydratase [Campylobacter coli]|uniref:CDP-glucose 4,6-dehydratase n=1 Tax=Campylobacter coli TaxID=195 RepID=A0A5T1TBL8_CAMCO|nr:CDP-glucose 4,6-dehydratase [Campylobacter coli]EIA54353.1 CDP-glucose 4,6-dehydratase [Campylobacter coli 2698]EAH7800262.1 CDP-glucose 4,6-dehydratase [Campylobacter coli]EAI6286267.1 CDP-glucose 4,6-dehydratase [Campylobacter coli]EAJ1077825.1 CDP-glucose 4,6-dehydratase [Campylobacter coli]EAJ1219125.1 CDP-glucose 4,6-dehydratase [Campylobacter coli]
MLFDIYKNKKVFISGHTGFKGSWLSLWLNYIGAKVYGYSLQPNTTPNHFEIINLQDKLAQNYFADINDLKKLEEAMIESDPEIIFHLAAQPLVRYSYKNPLETFQTNAMGTFNILNCARKLKNLKAIVIITTDKVYENKEWLWGYREDESLGGYDPYSASKACAEIITNSMRQSFFNIDVFGKSHGVLVASARAGNVIGGGDWSQDRLIPDIIKAASENSLAIIRNPKSTRPWQHVLEPLRGYLMLGERLLLEQKEFATSFNFGPNNEGDLSVEDVLKLASLFWDKISYQVQVDLNTSHEANLLMLDISKARKMLNWTPILNSSLSVEWTIKWYREFYENKITLTSKQLENYMEKL